MAGKKHELGLYDSLFSGATLATYQQRLLGVMQAPAVRVEQGSHGSWWRDLLMSPASSEIALSLPGLSLARPLAGRPNARLSLAAYRIRSVRYERGHTQVQWQPISELVIDDLLLTSADPLSLLIPPPAPLTGITGGISNEELLLEIVIETLDEQGSYRPERHMFRLAPHREGDYMPATHKPQGQAATLLSVDPFLLPEPEDAKR